MLYCIDPDPRPKLSRIPTRLLETKKMPPEGGISWSNQFLFFTLHYFVYFMIGIVFTYYCPISLGYQISFINNLKIFSNSPKLFYNFLFSHLFAPHDLGTFFHSYSLLELSFKLSLIYLKILIGINCS